MVTHTYIDLEIQEAQKLADLVGVEYDLKTTKEWCMKFNELMGNINSASDIMWQVESLSTAIVIRFTRSFAGGVRNKNSREILSILDNESKQKSEYFQNLRSKHVAHSVNAFEENYVKAYYVEEAVEKRINSIQTGSYRIVGLSSTEIEEIYNVSSLLLIHIEEEIKKEKEKLLELTKNYTEQEIFRFNQKVPKHPREISITSGRH